MMGLSLYAVDKLMKPWSNVERCQPSVSVCCPTRIPVQLLQQVMAAVLYKPIALQAFSTSA